MIADSIIHALRNALGEGNFQLHEPRFAGNEQHYVQQCIASTYVSSVGAYVDRFEKDLAAYTGSRRAVAVVNGTAALQVALQLAGVKANDEVIVPALSWSTTVWPLIQHGLVPVIVDIDIETLNINIDEIEKAIGPKTRAIMPVHVYGNPCDMEKIYILSKKYKFKIIISWLNKFPIFWIKQMTASCAPTYSHNYKLQTSTNIIFSWILVNE